MWANTLWEHGLPAAQWSVAIGASLVAALTDLRGRRIPNLLTGPVWAAGLVWAGATCGGLGLLDSAAGCVLLALPYVLLFIFAGGGAGDAKLMGALGAWLGLRNGAIVLVAVAVAGGIVALGVAAYRGRLRSSLANIGGIASGAMMLASGQVGMDDARLMVPRTETMQKVPYGTAIFAGVCAAAAGVFLWRG